VTTGEANSTRGRAEAALTGRAVARLAKHVEGALAHVELSLPQYRVLVILAKGSAAASALASRLAVSPPSVTALVGGLVSRGLVERQSVSGDRRRVDHVLTAAGRRVLADADAAVSLRLQEVAGYLPLAERMRAVAGLHLWHKAMDAYLGARVARRT
jgi:DNA-binding MarR family transcriptional regulator